MILWIVKYWRLVSILVLLAGLGISHFMAYNKGVQAERNRNVTKVIEIEKKQDDIRNHRPDDDGIIDILRRGNL